MRMTLTACAFALIGSSLVYGQRAGRLGGGGNVINPGIPLNGGPTVSGPRFPSGVSLPGAIPAGGNLPVGSTPFGGFGASMLPPPVAPAFPRGARRGGFGGGFGGGFAGGYYGGGYYGGSYVDGFYRSVYNPPPGTYDPIFGNYNPGVPGTYGVYPADGGTPTVVINQNFQPDVARPQMRDYSNVALPEPGAQSSSSSAPQTPANINAPANAVRVPAPAPGEQQVYFLIALKDSTIEAAVAYWVENNTLFFVNLQGQQGSVPMDQVDRDMSKRLNQGRRVGFGLPGQ